jgi:hypothetical protein
MTAWVQTPGGAAPAPASAPLSTPACLCGPALCPGHLGTRTGRLCLTAGVLIPARLPLVAPPLPACCLIHYPSLPAGCTVPQAGITLPSTLPACAALHRTSRITIMGNRTKPGSVVVPRPVLGAGAGVASALTACTAALTAALTPDSLAEMERVVKCRLSACAAPCAGVLVTRLYLSRRMRLRSRLPFGPFLWRRCPQPRRGRHSASLAGCYTQPRHSARVRWGSRPGRLTLPLV